MDRPMKPDYGGGSIVNLMASIAGRYGVKTGYPTLRALPPRELKKRTVLIIIDGMGYEFLRRYGKDTFLARHLRGSMTSVFPPTTAAAVTTYYTGVAPQQHGYTGWFINLKEMGGIHAALPFVPWAGGGSLIEQGFDLKTVLKVTPLSDRMRCRSVAVNPIHLNDTPYTRFVTGRSRRQASMRAPGPSGIGPLFRTTLEASRRTPYVVTYWDWLDHSMHEKGYSHPSVRKHLRAIDKEFEKFVGACKDVTIIVTADHGQMMAKRTIHVSEHPLLADCLALPLSGEPRTAYCHVRAHKTKEFERYVKTHLSKYCDLVRSDKLIDDGWFGLGRRHPALAHHVGDYVLIMKEGCIIKDKKLGKRESSIGNHGGVSSEEMLVPLIVVQT